MVRLYDTARGEVVPLEAGPVVTLYSCGITPYDSAHLGHAQVYLTFDILQRRLRDLGHETRCVRNVTDVDDDILRKARELGRPLPRPGRRGDRPVRRRHGRAGPDPGVVRAPGHLGHRRDPHPHRLGARLRPRLPGRRRGLLRRHHVRRVRRGEPLRPGDHAGPGRRARREPRRSQQAPPARLRAVAAVAARRAVVGVAVGTGPARAGTSSARPWPCASWGRPSTSTAAAATWSSPTTSARRPSPSRSPGGRSSATGSTSGWSAWTGPRCPSPSATWSSWATC